MFLQNVFLLMALVLQQSSGQIGPLLSEISEVQKQAIVDKHNEFRRQVQPTASNMMKMLWNEKAEATAKSWASKCQPVSSSNEDRKVDGLTCGEILLQTNHAIVWSDVIESFASEQTYFQYGIGTTDPEKSVTAYTQIVWHNSNQVGCALVFCPENGGLFMHVCHYCPGGNLQSQLNKPYKEGPPCGDCAGDCEDNLCNSACTYSDAYEHCEDFIDAFSCSPKFVQDRCKSSCLCAKDEE